MKSAVQGDFFDDFKPEYLSIEECAKSLGVSGTTIRNWVKTGHLQTSLKGKIPEEVVEKFKNQTPGKEKLKKRANKSRKDFHDHKHLASLFLEKAKEGTESIDLLGESYESSLSDSYRNKEGIYYTPMDIVSDLLTVPPDFLEKKRFCDPCCGSGNFLVRVLELGFRPENIFGFDVDPVAVEITKKRIYKKTGYLSENIKCEDFLHLSISGNAGYFDYIFTNPPWGKKIEKAEKELISKRLHAGRSLDTCSFFFFSCVNSLHPDGKLGLLLPEAFFSIGAYEDARAFALSHKIERLSSYGKPFKGLMTGAVGLVLSKTKESPKTAIDCSYDNMKFQRDAASFQKNPKLIFNISCTSEDAEVISHVYSIPHLTLNHRAVWGLGIVTGNNAKYFENSSREGLLPVYKGSDLTKSGLKPASNYISEDFSHYQQVAPLALYKSREKLIYKFISSDLCFFHDTEGRFIVNSANMLILNESFPASMKVVCDLFNSEFMSWLFRKLFNTNKILRGDLEGLPIHTQFLFEPRFSEAEYLDSIRVERTGCGTFRIKR